MEQPFSGAASPPRNQTWVFLHCPKICSLRSCWSRERFWVVPFKGCYINVQRMNETTMVLYGWKVGQIELDTFVSMAFLIQVTVCFITGAHNSRQLTPTTTRTLHRTVRKRITVPGGTRPAIIPTSTVAICVEITHRLPLESTGKLFVVTTILWKPLEWR